MPLVRIDLPDDLGVDRSAVVFVQILMVRGYSTASKKATFAAIAEELEAVGVRPDDVFVAVTENGPEDWYAGRAGRGTAA